MAAVGVSALRQDLSGVLRMVEQGERVVVTVHGRPVADLVPHTGTRPTWRPLRDLAAMFPGAHDPDWHQDTALVDHGVTDPFERGRRTPSAVPPGTALGDCLPRSAEGVRQQAPDS